MDVKIYTTPTCSWCKKAKDLMKKNNITFTEVSVAGNQEATQEMMKKSSQMGVPVIEIDGKIIVGYAENELKLFLKN